MPNKKGKLPPLKFDSLVMRFVDTSTPTRAVIATENPVRRFDEQHQCIVNEVLLMDGCEFRNGRSQVPIVDSHDDSTVRNIIGSIQRIQIDQATGELYGAPTFASDPDAQVIAARMNEGHITDFSITAQPIESLFIPQGHSYTTNRGNVIPGPAVIHKRWQPHNASICATGADEYSTVRRSYTELTRIKRMDEALLAQLASLGLPEGMTDPSQALLWMAGKMSASVAPEAAAPVENAFPPAEDKPAVDAPPAEEKPVENMAMGEEEKAKVMNQAATAKIKRALSDDQARRTEIQSACTLAKVERSFADDMCNQFVSVSEARKRIIERMATQPLGATVESGVRVTGSADDKLHDAMRDGLIIRSRRAAGIRTAAFADGKAAPGSEDFANMRLNRIAEMCVAKMGIDVSRMAPKDIALVAMGHPSANDRYRVKRDAYHTTGNFSNLLMDATNKTLLAGYEEAPYTWEMWARNAGTTSDFKAIHRIRFSEMATPEMVPENTDYPEAKMSDAKESYTIHKFGSIFTITWETVVNDDLDAISRIPAMQGAACRRLQNQRVYGVLTANANMADGGALFNTTAQTTAGGHANAATGAGAPSVATLNTAFVSMMTKKGLRSDVVLNIQPSFLIVPAALSATALQLLGSIADPSAGGSALGNSNTKNIYGPNGDRPLRVIIDPQLDANSTTAWYLVANNSQVDTVELTFLEGEQSPVLESEWDFDKDVYKYKVRQTFGTAAIDYRGMYRHAGA